MVAAGDGGGKGAVVAVFTVLDLGLVEDLVNLYLIIPFLSQLDALFV